MPAPQRRLAPLDPPMVPVVLAGVAAFALSGLVLAGTLPWHGRADWVWICVAGFLLGFPGLAVVRRRERRRR